MNNRLMRFGAVLYDAWWIWLLTLVAGYGAGTLVQWRFPHMPWAAWVLIIVAGIIIGQVGAWLMVRWHRRCEARRRYAQWQRAFDAFGHFEPLVHSPGCPVGELEALLSEQKGGDDEAE